MAATGAKVGRAVMAPPPSKEFDPYTAASTGRLITDPLTPAQRGVHEAIGETIGGAVGDPRNAPFLGMGGASPIMRGLISAGFATQMGKGAVEGAGEYGSVMDNPAVPESEKSRLATQAILSTAMAGMAGAGVREARPEVTPRAEANIDLSAGLVPKETAPPPARQVSDAAAMPQRQASAVPAPIESAPRAAAPPVSPHPAHDVIGIDADTRLPILKPKAQEAGQPISAPQATPDRPVNAASLPLERPAGEEQAKPSTQPQTLQAGGTAQEGDVSQGAGGTVPASLAEKSVDRGQNEVVPIADSKDGSINAQLRNSGLTQLPDIKLPQEETLGRHDSESDRKVVQPVSDPELLRRAALSDSDELANKTASSIHGIQGASFERLRPEKKPSRVQEKIQGDGQPPETVTDYLADQVVVDSLQAKDDVVNSLKKNFEIIDQDDKFEKGHRDKAGFRAVSLQVKTPSGMTAQIQVVPKETYAVSEQSHDLYTQGRDAELRGDLKTRDEKYQQAQKINDDAWAQFQKRNSTKSEIVPRGTLELKRGDRVTVGGRSGEVAWIAPESKLGARVKFSDGKTETVKKSELRQETPQFTQGNQPGSNYSSDELKAFKEKNNIQDQPKEMVGESPAPGKTGEMSVGSIKQNPGKFQYKLNTDAEGVGTLLKGNSKYNPELAGVINVWTDPSDGQTYVVNGHHRLELARRTGEKSVLVRHVVAHDAQEARATGALQNIAEGRGTAVDAAKFLRDTGTTPEKLQAEGVSMGEATAAKGVALSKLDDSLFNKVVQGDIPIERAVAIGEATADHAEQKAISDLVDKQEAKGKRVTNDTLRELIRFVKGSEQKTVTSASLFGEQEVSRSLALEKAEVSAYIKQQLAKDKKLFGFVSKDSRAEELERGNNIIDVKTSGRLAQEATQGEEVYNKLSERVGPIADILSDAARRLADGESANAVKQEAYNHIHGELSQALGSSVKARSGQRSGEPARASREATLGGREEKSSYRQNAKRGELDWSGGLSEDQISAWSKSTSLKIEAAGEQDTLFGAAEKMYRFTRNDSEGAPERALVKHSQIESLVENNNQRVIKALRKAGMDVPWPEQEEESTESPKREEPAQAGLFAKGYGESNKLVTKEQYEQAKKSLSDKLTRLSAGVDPSSIPELMKIGAYHLEAGAREFAAWSKKMVEELGDKVKPHLQKIYDAITVNPQDKQKAPTFFSKAEKVAQEKLPNSILAGAVSKTLENAGVKPEEMKWLGLDDFLTGKGKVSKQDVLDYIRQNQVQVHEVMKGEPRSPDEAQEVWQKLRAALQKDDLGGYDTVAEAKRGVLEALEGREGNEWSPETLAAAREYKATIPDRAKFENYQLPGGKDYRELLLTLPQTQLPQGYSVERVAHNDSWGVRSPDGQLHSAAWRTPDAAIENELRKSSFRSSHFDEPNVLAHIRFNDRTDADNKKVLFLEELQSDWHQKGRREGYKNPDIQKRIDALDAERQKIEDDRIRNGTQDKDAPPEVIDRWTAIKHEIRRLESMRDKGVPDAPFKSSWHELALKRMLRYAAENGYDKLGWTPGEVQNDRYDLSKHIDSLTWVENKNGTFSVQGEKDGHNVVTKADIQRDDLANVVGKDVAEKIANHVGKEDPPLEPHENAAGKLSNLDLKVGGSGMKGFYDKIIPDFLNKYGKKWGARVGETEITDGKRFAVEHHPEYEKEKWHVVQSGPDHKLLGTFKTEDFARAFARDMGKKTAVPAIDITPSMKQSVMEEGQPLFAHTPVSLLNPKVWRDSFPSTTEWLKGKVSDAISTSDVEKMIVRQRTGELARTKEQAHTELKDQIKHWDKASKDESLKFIDNIESGKKQGNILDNRLAAQLRTMLDDGREAVRSLGTGKLDNFIENYFPHIWEQPSKAKEIINRMMGKRPLQGTASFLKQRTIPTTAEGIEAGLKPVTYNPVELALLKIHEMNRYVAAHQILGDMKNRGMAQFVKFGQKAPDGWTQLQDPMFHIMSPSNEGMVLRGNYYAPKEAADILHNYLSPGLNQYKGYRAFRSAENALNQAQLGVSLFHLGTTSVNAYVSDLALGIKQLSRLDPKGFIPVARSLVAPVRTYMLGRKMMDSYLKPESYSQYAKLASAVAEAGGRAKQDSFYMTDWKQRADRLWKDGDHVKSVGTKLAGYLQSVGAPIMEHFVPRMKLGAFGDLARDVFDQAEKHEWSEDKTKIEMQKAWDTIDNRMGQLVYDNIFVPKFVKDIGLVTFRSLGWNLGTVREIGGGIKDIAKQGARTFVGERPEVTDRMAYTLALPIGVGLLGGMWHYAHTGELPQEAKDYFFPKTGRKDARGDDERVSFPSYMKDVFAFAHNPTSTISHKVNPLVSSMIDVLNNEDFYGTEIRHPDDPLMKQAMQVIKYGLEQFEPFSMRNIQQSKRRGEGIGKAVLQNVVGITPAPGYINRSPASELAYEDAQRKLPKGPRTTEEADKADKRRQISEKLRSGEMKSKDLIPLVQSGEITLTQAKNMVESLKQSSLEHNFRTLSLPEALEVWDKMSDAEKSKMRQALFAKRKQIFTAPKEQRSDLARRFRAVFMGQPDRTVYAAQ